MDRAEYVRKRKGRYMAQILEEFEREVEPFVPEGVAQSFKAMVRRKVTALAADCTEVMELDRDQMAMNGAAQSIKDSLHPDGSASRSPQAPRR